MQRLLKLGRRVNKLMWMHEPMQRWRQQQQQHNKEQQQPRGLSRSRSKSRRSRREEEAGGGALPVRSPSRIITGPLCERQAQEQEDAFILDCHK